MVEYKKAGGNMKDLVKCMFRDESLSFQPHSVGPRKSHGQPKLWPRGREVHLTSEVKESE